ncbi:periplasmic nitrate reductase chaperone NapD [Volucribacter psittacicida]|uniref:Chaperone NapD n=1 Tax=Volucribacter psittacicida TaxID=203482 RepID=A0A4R1FWW3_9PAST|nr:chaperone NapD [Volucribacter psittacicida]TCJ95881.1 periplasmic nitrate reductase chaperone NapD [Volucribacter psittacicida]
MQQTEADDWHVCGLVVQGKPEKLLSIQTALLAIEHTEVAAVDEQTGKLVVVMQSHDERILLENMEMAKNIDGVLVVSLVYHQQDVQHSEE